jgi:hypothetical protein
MTAMGGAARWAQRRLHVFARVVLATAARIRRTLSSVRAARHSS